MQNATSEIQLDNEKVRVTRWDFPPGTETGDHTHEYDYVVVPIQGGTLTVQTPEETIEREISQGVSYEGFASTQHNVQNHTEKPISFVEIERK